MTSRLTHFFQIRPGEGRLVAKLIALLLLLNMGGAIGTPGVEALFYSRLGVEFLPYLYIALGITTMLVSLLLSGLLGRLSKRKLYRALPPFLALSMILARSIVGLDLNWFYPILWLWTYIMWTLQALLVWGVAGMLCDTRQAKRLFPLLGAGGIVGIVLGGLVTRILVAELGSENLLFVWAGGLALASAVVHLLLRDVREPEPRTSQSHPHLLDEVQMGFRYVRKTRLLRWIAVAAVLFSVLFFSVSFPFSKTVAAEFHDEDALTGFLGIFRSASNLMAFLISLLFANRLYARFGFMIAILIFPLIYLAGFGTLLLTGIFFLPLTIFRFIQLTWLFGMADTAYQSVFNIVPESHREQARAFINGVPTQLGTLLTGILLAIGAARLTDEGLFWIGMGAALITAYAIWRGSKAYREALVEALRAGQPHLFFPEEQPFGGFRQDAAALETVIGGLSDSSPSVRRISADILGRLAVPEANEAILNALEDPDPEVRAALLRALARANVASALLEVAACLQDESAEVRQEAVAALVLLASHPRGVRAHLAPLLDDAELPVRTMAARAILRFGEYAPAAALLRNLVEDPDPDARVAALESFATWGDPSCFALAAHALKDPQPRVRRTAAQALTRLEPSASLPLLIDALGDKDPSVLEAVAAALKGLGSPALRPLVDVLQDPQREKGALLALEGVPVRSYESELFDYARLKTERARHYDGMWRQLIAGSHESGRLALLRSALRENARSQAALALQTVGLIEGSEEMGVALRNLKNPLPAQRANALEILDTLREREIVQPLMHMWEPDAPASDPINGPDPTAIAAVISQILGDSDDWLRACAVMAWADLDLPELQPGLEELAQGELNPLLQETLDYVLTPLQTGGGHIIPRMERIGYLQQVPIFESLAPDEILRVAEISGEKAFEDGQRIAEQGDLGDEMYILVDGEIDVLVKTEGQESAILRKTAREFVGEMSIISHGPRTASLAAVGRVRTLNIKQAPFEKILRETPEIRLALIQTLIVYLARTHR
jgi:HEAT repeat protein